MRTALLIARNGLRLAARDRKALLLTLVMPFVMTALLGNALGGMVAGAGPVSGLQYYAAAMALLFILTGTIQRGGTLLEERQSGTLQRMLTAPVARGEVLAGQALGSAVLALAQCVLLMAGTRLLFGVTWGTWYGALLLGGSFSLAAAGIGTALAGMLKDRKAMDIASGAISNLLGLLSGALIPLSAFPTWLKTFAHFTPNYWAMEGLLDQMAGVDTPRLWLPAAVLACIALVTGAFGTWRMAAR
jgi:ABC-2 type transport system permease protein